jgi:hypothetical protein
MRLSLFRLCDSVINSYFVSNQRNNMYRGKSRVLTASSFLTRFLDVVMTHVSYPCPVPHTVPLGKYITRAGSLANHWLQYQARGICERILLGFVPGFNSLFSLLCYFVIETLSENSPVPSVNVGRLLSPFAKYFIIT